MASKRRIKQKNSGRAAVLHGAAFFLPVLALAVVFVAIGLFPAGGKSSLALDMRSQYISFFSYLRNQVWLGGQGYQYTFSMALGGNMAGLSAYYLLSPFNLLLLLFPTRLLPVAVSLITLCKVGCCGLTMSLFLNRNGARFATLLFAVPYALMDFIIAFQLNIMWLDGVILLPIVILGIERMLEGKSPACYLLSLAGAIIVNYYIGFMLCLFSVAYFAATALGFHQLKGREALRQTGQFAGASLLAGGLSAFVLLPVLMAMQGGKAGFSAEGFFNPSFATLADVTSRYLPGTANVGQIFFGYPALYTGMLALLCTVLYFAAPRLPRRAKTAALLLLLLPLFSFVIGPVDRIWHGFNKPVGFLFRYSFIFSFLLLALGWQGYQQLNKASRRWLPGAVALLGAAAWLAQRPGRDYITTGKLVFAALLLGGGALLLWLKAGGKLRHASLVLLVFMLSDMGASMYLSMRWMDYLPMEQYQSFVNENQPLVNEIKNRDNGFYRMEKTYAFSDNDAMLLGYNGLSHYSSVDRLAIREFLDLLGFSDGGYSVKYVDGSTVAMDNFLGVRYLISAGNMPKAYQPFYKANGKQVWANPNALPLGFMAGEGVLAPLPETANLFEVQNQLWHALDPTLKKDLYRPAEAQQQLDGVSRREYDGEDLFEKQQDNGRVEYRIKVTSEDMLYALFTTASYRGARLYINGDLFDNFLTNDRHGIVPLGQFKKGDEVVVALEPISGELFVGQQLFYYEDSKALEESCARLAEGGWQLETFSGSCLSGTVQSGGGQLLLTLPYDSGWKATVNGQPAPLTPALGVLTALQLPEGECQVTLRFTPPGLVVGLWVSALCLLVFLLWWWRFRRTARKFRMVNLVLRRSIPVMVEEDAPPRRDKGAVEGSHKPAVEEALPAEKEPALDAQPKDDPAKAGEAGAKAPLREGDPDSASPMDASPPEAEGPTSPKE